MGNRLSVIATRTGDDGTTGLGDGSRCPKDSLRVIAMGDVDELNSVIGVLRSETLPHEVDADLSQIQHDLFDLGAELCIPGHVTITVKHIQNLDERLTHYNDDLPALREFILPGGAKTAAYAHVARTVCRRAERAVVSLNRDQAGRAETVQYLNRLSDLLFVLARVLNRAAGGSDVHWQSPVARVD